MVWCVVCLGGEKSHVVVSLLVQQQGMKKPIFEGCVFSTAGSLSRSSLDLSKAIKENGGTLSYLITKKVRFVTEK